LICREKDIKINNYNDLDLWKADFAYGYKLKDLTEEQICKDSELLVPIVHFKDYFPDQKAVNKSLIFVQVPVTGKCLNRLLHMPYPLINLLLHSKPFSHHCATFKIIRILYPKHFGKVLVLSCSDDTTIEAI